LALLYSSSSQKRDYVCREDFRFTRNKRTLETVEAEV